MRFILMMTRSERGCCTWAHVKKRATVLMRSERVRESSSAMTRGYSNHREYAIKAKALLSGSESGHGFGSALHTDKGPDLPSGPFLLPEIYPPPGAAIRRQRLKHLSSGRLVLHPGDGDGRCRCCRSCNRHGPIKQDKVGRRIGQDCQASLTGIGLHDPESQ